MKIDGVPPGWLRDQSMLSSVAVPCGSSTEMTS